MSWLTEFSFTLSLDTDAFDAAVRHFAVNHASFFDAIKSSLTSFVNGIYWLLSHTPWFLVILLVFLLIWKTRKSLRAALLYSVLLFVIGLFGMWELMNVTLAIVIAGVIIALLIGLPVGVLISGSARANRLLRPVLDMMQTMPVFVYLIPTVIFFSMGSTSAVIATVIYAMVPAIRLTSLGIR